MIHSGVTQGTPSNIPFGAGVYFAGVEYSETVAPEIEAIKAAITPRIALAITAKPVQLALFSQQKIAIIFHLPTHIL